MTMTPDQQRSIIQKESAWIDSSFGGLDLSAFPCLNDLPPAEKHDDRFARAYGDTALSRSASALRSFVSDPDVEALKQAGTETGNPHLLDEVRDQRGERVVMDFKFRNPSYLPTPDNYELMMATLAHNALEP